jgi:hypothetical protein
MRITINQEIVSPDTDGVTNFAELFQRLLDRHIGPGNVVISVTLNRETLDEEKMRDLASVPLSRIERLELQTTSVMSLVLDGTGKINQLIDQLVPAMEQTADKFRTRPEEEANRYFRECLDGLMEVVEYVENFEKATGIDFDRETVRGAKISDRQKSLLEVSNRLHGAQREKDWVMLADLLEYELTPVLQEWKEIFSELGTRVRDRIN